MNTFKEYLYKAHCEGEDPSSKRFWGGIGFGVVLACLVAATILSFVKTGELSGHVSSLLEFDLVTSAALLGLSKIAEAFGNGKSVSIGGESNLKESEE